MVSNFIRYVHRNIIESCYDIKVIDKNVELVIDACNDKSLIDLANRIVKAVSLAKEHGIYSADIIRPIFYCFKFTEVDTILHGPSSYGKRCYINFKDLNESVLAFVNQYVDYLLNAGENEWQAVKRILIDHNLPISYYTKSVIFSELIPLAVNKLKSLLSIRKLSDCIDDISHFPDTSHIGGVRFVNDTFIRVFCVDNGNLVYFSRKVNIKTLVKVLNNKAFILFDMFWIRGKTFHSDYGLLINDGVVFDHLKNYLGGDIKRVGKKRFMRTKCSKFIVFNRFSQFKCSLLYHGPDNNSIHNVFFVKHPVTLREGQEGSDTVREVKTNVALVQLLGRSGVSKFAFNTLGTIGSSCFDNIVLTTPFALEGELNTGGGFCHYVNSDGSKILGTSFQFIGHMVGHSCEHLVKNVCEVNNYFGYNTNVLKLTIIHPNEYFYFSDSGHNNMTGAYNSIKHGSSISSTLECYSPDILAPLYNLYLSYVTAYLWLAKIFDNETFGTYSYGNVRQYSLSEIYGDLVNSLNAIPSDHLGHGDHAVFLSCVNSMSMLSHVLEFLPTLGLTYTALGDNCILRKLNLVAGNLVVHCGLYVPTSNQFLSFKSYKFRFGVVGIIDNGGPRVHNIAANLMSNCLMVNYNIKGAYVVGSNNLFKYLLLAGSSIPYYRGFNTRQVAVPSCSLYAQVKFYLLSKFRFRFINAVHYLGIPPTLNAGDNREFVTITDYNDSSFNKYNYLFNPRLGFHLFLLGDGTVYDRWISLMCNSIFFTSCLLFTYDKKLAMDQCGVLVSSLRNELGLAFCYHQCNNLVNLIWSVAIECRLVYRCILKLSLNIDKLINANLVKRSLFSVGIKLC